MNKHILKTFAGKAFVGSRAVFMGYDLHKDLRNIDWVELYLMSITGKKFNAKEVKLFHAIWVCTSYPDVRLWNNRVAGLAGSSRSTPAQGLGAALAVSDALVYGGHPCVRIADFLAKCRQQVEKGIDLTEIVTKELKSRRIYGYGRPINNKDERLQWIDEISKNLELNQGPHYKLAHLIETILVQINPLLKMNYAAVLAALCLDMGLSAKQVQLFVFPMFIAGMTPCYNEAVGNPESELFKLECSDIDYKGVAPRNWEPL